MLIYKATTPSNKFYIGCTSGTLARRIVAHKSVAIKKQINTPFAKAIRKYGIENIKWEILFENNNHQELLKKEIEFISIYNSLVPNGYNVTKGGEGTTGLSSVFKGKKLSFERVQQIKKYTEHLKKKTIVVNLETKEILYFDSVKSASNATNVDYTIARICAKNSKRFHNYRFFTEHNFNKCTNVYENKPSHNAKTIKITNNITVETFLSIASAGKFLNLSETKMRRLVYKNKKYNGWRILYG